MKMALTKGGGGRRTRPLRMVGRAQSLQALRLRCETADRQVPSHVHKLAPAMGPLLALAGPLSQLVASSPAGASHPPVAGPLGAETPRGPPTEEQAQNTGTGPTGDPPPTKRDSKTGPAASKGSLPRALDFAAHIAGGLQMQSNPLQLARMATQLSVRASAAAWRSWAGHCHATAPSCRAAHGRRVRVAFGFKH